MTDLTVVEEFWNKTHYEHWDYIRNNVLDFENEEELYTCTNEEVSWWAISQIQNNIIDETDTENLFYEHIY